MNSSIKEKNIHFFALFTSLGTLLCCALPATLAAIAGGGAVASMVSALPWLVPLSQNKNWIFLISGALIFISGLFAFRPDHKLICSITGGKKCKELNRFSKIMFYVSLFIFGIGFFFAYGLTPILRWLET